MLDLLRKYRRELHRIPEKGRKEFKTRQYIFDILKNYDCELTEAAETGLCAWFPGPVGVPGVAFRADMDGLPLSEPGQTEYRSTHEGFMHACGHDGHMAMLLGLARWLQDHKDNRPRGVLLIFQPAEEGPGGAKEICETGILEKYNVQQIFGFHIGPSEIPGAILGRPGGIMARTSDFDVIIEGRSAHCSTPEKGIDALEIGAEFLLQVYEMARTKFPPEVFRLVRFGKMDSGDVRNVLSDRTVLKGILRAYDDAVFESLWAQMEGIARNLEAERGCTIRFHVSKSYPATINDPQLFLQVRDVLKDFPFITLKEPYMASEDFSFYLQKIPGLFLFLGTGRNTPLHSKDFDFDEEILVKGLEAWLRIFTSI